MSKHDTNIYPIINLGCLSSIYRLYRIRGLSPDQDNYYKNRDRIVNILSFKYKTAATVIELKGHPHLALPEDAPQPESSLPLIGTTAIFESLSETFELDYTKRDKVTDDICIRFLNHFLQKPLWKRNDLWQLGSGKPFYKKSPAEVIRGIARCEGFSMRAVITPGGGIGLCIDFTSKFVSKDPLPTIMTADQFRPYKNKNFVYHYGTNLYQVKLRNLHDLSVSEHQVDDEGEQVSLLKFIYKHAGQPLPEDLRKLPSDASFAAYRDNSSGTKGAPTGLCYEIYDTQHPAIQKSHNRMTPPPHIRRKLIEEFVKVYLQNLEFGSDKIVLGTQPVAVPQKIFQLPDFEFGNKRILSVRGTEGTERVNIDKIGEIKLARLQDKDAGFYTKDTLGKQYLFMPESIAATWGEQFVRDLQSYAEDLYGQIDKNSTLPSEPTYNPIIVTYDDFKPHTFQDQGAAILEAAKRDGCSGGYALVMAHHTNKKKIREHDQLSAMILSKFDKEFDLRAAVIHSLLGHESYVPDKEHDGQQNYVVDGRSRGRFSGYLRNVVLNKILLTNEKWPFVLSTPLHADLTIGIDVKNHTAGFTLVCNKGKNVRTKCNTSSEKEKLSKKQVKKFLKILIQAEATSQHTKIENIVVHRDGRIHQSEIDGAHEAIEDLIQEKIICETASITFVEVSKSSPSYLRLLDVTYVKNRSPFVDNPCIGSYCIINESDGYLCSTGREFHRKLNRKGTVRPLHVKYKEGTMPFEDVLEDLYHLTSLTWTRPEDCSRYPITIKLTDRRLSEDAEDYDKDAIDLYDEDEIEEEEQ